MMPAHTGCNGAADRVVRGLEGLLAAWTAPYDPDRQMERAALFKTSGFAEAIVDHQD